MTNTMTTGERLTELHRLMGEIDEANRQLSALKEARRNIETALQRDAEQNGVDSFRNELITVTIREDFIASYDPDHWDDLVKWAGDTGNTHIIQRRVSTKPIQELIDNGSELPAGVRLEPQIKLTARRR